MTRDAPLRAVYCLFRDYAWPPNGRIYTVDEAQPRAEAVAIKDGEFLVVGSGTDV